jgi:hypothetical protein
MKFCQPHWDRLKTAIESRGLGHLIAANGRDAIARMVADLEQRSELSDYDPLMSAHWKIVSVAEQYLGLSLYFGEAICPLCEVLKVYPPIPNGHRYASNESYFIDGPADAELDFAKENGLWPASADIPAVSPDPGVKP